MWNYRVIKEKENDEEWLEVREVYYDQLGKPMGHCTATVGGETLGELETILEMMRKSLEKPILTFNLSHE
jgi:hypothetical protein